MEAALIGIQRVLSALAGQCQSDRTAEVARSLPPLGTVQEAGERLELTTEAVALLDSGAVVAIQRELDHERALAIANRGGVLDGEALRSIGMALRCADGLRAIATTWSEAAPTIALRAARLPRARLLADLLCDSFDERGELLDEASPELLRLRQDVRNRARGLRTRIDQMVKESDREGVLQDDYYTIRDGRFVLPVKASDKRVVGGIVHGSSQTGQTVYIEPREMVEANNALTLAADAVKREERRILAEFSQNVADHDDAIERTCTALSELDLVFAFARLAGLLGATRPELSATTDRVALRGLRHPQLVLDAEEVVANDVVIEAPSTWLVVSGPNGGGKTVLLTAVGMAFAMARRGLFVCAAADSVVPRVQAVELVLGDAQDLDAGLSTFSGHVARVAAALQAARDADGAVLVLLDELASGTEPLAGSALARAILEEFAGLGCLGLVATHYEGLKLLPLRDDRFTNASLALDPKSLTPTFELRVGSAGSSSPMALAERMGLPASVVQRARDLIGTGSGETEQMLQRLQELKSQAERDQRAAAAERKQAEQARQRLDEQRRFEKRAVDKRIDAAAKEALVEIHRAREAARAARKRLSKPKVEAREVEQRAHEINVSERKIRGKRKPDKEQTAMVQREKMAREAMVPGAIAWHAGLGRPVEIVEIDARGKKVRVQAGVMALTAKPADLHVPLRRELPQKPVPKAAPKKAPTVADAGAEFDDDDTVAFRSPDRTCDLRGMRAEEALVEVDRCIDSGVVAGARGVCIVHGMGTGALRKAVEAHLRGHPQVLRSRIGGRGEGGAGATMVWLNS